MQTLRKIFVLQIKQSHLSRLRTKTKKRTKKDLNTKIKSSLYSRYYTEARNEWRGPSPWLSACATQVRCSSGGQRMCDTGSVQQRWAAGSTVFDLNGVETEPKTSRAACDVFLLHVKFQINFKFPTSFPTFTVNSTNFAEIILFPTQ